MDFMKPIDELTEQVIGLAMKVHRTPGPGFLESVSQRALPLEPKRAGLEVESGNPRRGIDEGECVGDFSADLFVDGRLVIALKAVQQIATAHEVQTVNCLVATGRDDALLLNFGAASLRFKRQRRLPKS